MELTLLTKYYRDKIYSEMKTMNENIDGILTKLHDKYNKIIEKKIQPMSVQITELSPKYT